MTPKRILTACCLLAAAAGPFAATADEALGVDITPAAIDRALEALVAEHEVAGASALVYQSGEEVYFGAYGMADREAGTPMARDTIVQIYSMTKPITGVALLQLVEQGLVDLDEPVASYLPEFADARVYAGEDGDGKPVFEAPRRPPTVRDLTRHTAGLANGWETGGAVGEIYQREDPMNLDNDLAETARRLSRIPLAYHPGERWLYSDAVDLQARIVEVRSGQAYADYLREHILGPLGMDETAYFVPESERHRLAATYGPPDEDGALTRSPGPNLATWKHPLTPGGWGLASTVDEYMRFARMLQNEGELDGERILSAESVRLMATDHLPPEATERSWLPGKGQVGFGIDVAVRVAPPASPEENPGAVGEFFWDGAATTLFWVDPANDLTVVFFIQRRPFWNDAHKRIRDAVYGAPSPP